MAEWTSPMDLEDAGIRQVFARELVNELRRGGAAASTDPGIAFLRVPVRRAEFEQVVEAARRLEWVEPRERGCCGAGEVEWALTDTGRAVRPPESLELSQVLTRVMRFADPARQRAAEWLPLLALVVGAAAATQEASGSSTTTLNGLRLASIAVLLVALGRGWMGELSLLRAAEAFTRLQQGGFYEDIRRFFSKQRLRWVAAFDLAVVAAFGFAIFLSPWAILPAGFAVVSYVVVEWRWRTPARAVARREEREGRRAKFRPWVERAAKLVVGRALPIALMAGGLALPGLALLVAIVAAQVSGSNSLDDLVLLPKLGWALAIGLLLLIVAVLATVTVGPKRTGSRRERYRDLLVGLALGVGIVVAVAALLGALVFAAEVRSWFGRRGDIPQSESWAYATLAAVAIVVAAVVSFVMWLSLRIIGGRKENPDTVPIGALTAILVLAAAVTMLRDAPKPVEALRPRSDLVRVTERLGDPAVRYDVMLLVDPADPVGRQLVDVARTSPAQLLAPRRDSVRADVAFGVAAMSPEPRGWRLLVAPTTHRRRVVAALARLAGRRAPDLPAAYGAALVALGTTPAVRWRPGSVRSLSLLAARPPSRRQLHLRRPASPSPREPIPAAIRAIAPDEPRRRRAALGPEALVVDLVLAPGAKRTRLDRWRAWTRRTGGTVRHAGPTSTPFDAAEDALTLGPSARERKLALRHRPLLLFDSDEKRPPLDVDHFLAERGGDGEQAHRLCRAGGIDLDCRGVVDGLRLARESDADSVLELHADPPEDATNEFERDTSQRIYYRLTRDREPPRRVHIDYWVFYRFNDSPSLPRLTCFSGLAVKERTCFDHEGDWEGVTVTLTSDLEPQQVTYAGHSWRYRYPWETLRARSATKDEHPRVWVARGSHASYPAPCEKGRRSCHQPQSDLPDGERDGQKEWIYNEDALCEAAHCVVRLPLTRAGGPAGWGAYGGRWGRPRCTRGLKLCVRSSGPETPFFQKRYPKPGEGIPMGK